MKSPFETEPAERQPRWTTTTSRLLFVYTVTFLFSMLLLLVFVEHAVTGQMEHEVDVVMDWQLIYFDSTPDNLLPDAIQDRLENSHMHANYYGLFTPDGKHVAVAEHFAPALMLIDTATDRVIAKAALKNGTTLREEAVGGGYVTDAEFDAVVRPENMIGPG